MRALPLLLLFCILSVAPAYGQPVTPTPLPPAATLSGIAREVEQTGDAVSNLATSVGANTFVYLIVAVLLGLIIWYGLRPAFASTTEANRAAARANEQVAQTNQRLFEYLEDGSKVVTQNTAVHQSVQQAITANTGTLTALGKSIETSMELYLDRLTQEREAGVKAVNEHTDAATQRVIEALEQRVNTAIDKLDQILPRIEQRLVTWDDTIRVNLREIRAELKASAQEVERVKHDTDKLNPANVPNEDPAKPSLWDGDHPDNV